MIPNINSTTPPYHPNRKCSIKNRADGVPPARSHDIPICCRDYRPPQAFFFCVINETNTSVRKLSGIEMIPG